MKLTRLIAAFCAILLMVLTAGCFSTNRIVLATLDTPESVLIGEIMASKLENFGFEVVRGPRYQSLAELEAGMGAGEFDLSAIFVQDALTGSGVIAESPVFDQFLALEIVNNTIGELFGYTLLDAWLLDATYTLVIRERLAQDDQFNFAALARHAGDLTLASTQEFMSDPGGFAHMHDLFGELNFRETNIIGAPDIFGPTRLTADLLVVRSIMMGEWLTNAGYTAYWGGVPIWPGNSLHPIAREGALDRYPEIRAILSSISFQIDPVRFNQGLYAINQGEQTPEQAAQEILQAGR